ncbi:hypothetical protein [Virgibacillus sp. L01]|uniref:hypothetical protein n=1 Tax=Virgibacillus sp. L01 TaxID=3457429 RepID=UPI003FCF05A1
MLIGIGTTYFFNSTGPGTAIKEGIRNVAKEGYDALVDGVKSVRDGISDGLSKVGSFFGFGG